MAQVEASTLPVVLVEELPQQKSKDYRVYVINGNEYGDESKGKMMRDYLVGKGRRAKVTGRFNGGPNAGHTVYARPNDTHLFLSDNKRKEYQAKGVKLIKFATHQVPTGVLFGISSFIGYNAIVDLPKLHKELNEIAEQLGRTYPEVASLLVIFEETHLILPKHVREDKANNTTGTTGSGISRCYADKHSYRGFTIKQYYNNPDLVEFQELNEAIHNITKNPFANNQILGVEIKTLVDIVDLLQDGDVVVMEGAQGYLLDVSQGQNPFITGSDCTIGGACSYGFELDKIYVVGCSKAYTTYVGADVKESGFVQDRLASGISEMIRLLGKEYGVTTGRRRQCITFDLNKNIRALRANQTSDWIVSKRDILEQYHQLLKTLKKCCETWTPPETPVVENPQTPEEVLAKYMKDTKYDWKYYQALVTLGSYAVIHNGQRIVFDSWYSMKGYIYCEVRKTYIPKLRNIVWYDSPESEVTYRKQ